eukprot:8987166-Alexandrium_andersonii.AAC.1
MACTSAHRTVVLSTGRQNAKSSSAASEESTSSMCCWPARARALPRRPGHCAATGARGVADGAGEGRHAGVSWGRCAEHSLV